ncbi:MAG: ImmA/IrrE family metallo-endopeptidase [Patescibacteria group bacterium]|nr:ImmA/IrrE family metallo-endopeptidase [Patescibacteria group bacterium]
MILSDIEAKADAIAQAYNPDHVSPFPFENLTHEPVDIYLVDLGNDIAGAIEWDTHTKKFEIFVDEKKKHTKQYFTIAHALGHYFLHPDIVKKEEVLVDTVSMQATGDVATRECEANTFAAALIMPRELVKKAWTALQSVQECATIFHVSLSSMSQRLEALGLV